MQQFVKFIFCLSLFISGDRSMATTMIPIRGKIKQIREGKVEIITKDGLVKLVWKKLPLSRQDELRKAMSEHKEINMMVNIGMIAKK